MPTDDPHRRQNGRSRDVLGRVGPALDPAMRLVTRCWLAASAALIGVAVTTAGFGVVPAAPDLGPLTGSAEVAAPASGPTAAELDGLPLGHYAGVDIAVSDARTIPINSSGRPLVVVDLVVRNTLDIERRIPESMLRLVGPNGLAAQAQRFDFTDDSAQLTIDPGDSVTALAVFSLPPRTNVDVDDLRLEVAEPGRWPAGLPIVPPADRPVGTGRSRTAARPR